MLSTPPSRRSVLKVFPRFAIVLWLLAALPALGQAATVQFIDSWGHATSEIGYVRPVLVRVVDSGRGSALSLDSLSVSLSSPTGDVETVTCAETSRSSGVFEGQIQAYNAATASPQNQGFAVPDGLVATASYEPAAGGPAVTAEATANVIQLSFVGAGGAPVATVAEGALVSIELVGNEESFDPGQRDLLSLTVTRSGTSDSEVVELRETGNSSGIYRGSLQLASDGQSGAGILESSPAPATLTATYSRAFWPFLVRTRNVAVASAELELIDAFGNPAASVATEVRLRLREFYSGEGEGIGVRYATVSNDLSGDSELVVLDEVSPGVFEQRQPLAVSSSATTVGNLQLSAPAGSIVSAEHVLPSSGSVTASLPVGPSLTLLHADLTPAETFGKGEPLLIEVRFGGGNVSPARDTLTVDVSSDSAADTETALLTEISESSGVFRGRLNTLYTQAVGTSSNGVLEEGLPLLVYPTYRSERVHATFVAGSATASADAEVVFGRLETLHSSGEPATTFGSGATLRLRVQDFSVGTAGAVDSLSVGAACGSDFESLELRETAADSFVFEREVPVRIASSIYQNNKVECPTATTFDFNYYDGHVNILPVNLVSVAVEILSDTGEVGGDLLDGRRIRVRATDSSANLQPLFFDSVSATVSSRNTADSEVVTLRETSVNSGVFEGEVWVSSQASGSPLVSTAAGAAPLFRRDVITANYIGSEASAEVVPARLSLVDGSGNPISRAVSEVWVELEMPSFGSPTQVDMVNGSYSTAPWQSDNFTAYETSATSGIFTAHFWLGGMSIPEGSRFGIRFVTASETLSLSVPVVHYEVRFLDAAGAKLDSLPLGRPIRVEVRRSEALDNLGNWDQLAVALRSDVSEDVESLTLNEESTNWNGPLRGSLPLVAASTSVYDGTLQSGLVSPFGDTVRVELAGDQLEIGSAKLRRPQIFFRDAAGRSPEMLRVGDTYTVEVLDSAYDLNASAIDTFEVSFKVLGYQNDELTLGQLTVYETGLASGIFRAAFALTSNGVACPVPGNCLAFEPGVDSRVFAHHQFYGGTGLEEVSVRVGSEKLELVDADGNPVTEVLEGEPIHIRLTANDGYHTGLGSRTVTVGAQLSGDIETVTLWETFIRSGVYERTLPTRFFLGSSPPENGVLGLSADPQSEIATGESVIVHYNSIYTTGLPALEVSAATVAARLSVRNGVQPAVAVLPGYGQDWKIRLESPTLSAAGLTASFVVESSTGDIETYTVTSSPGGIFEAGVFFTTDGSAYPNDGVVFVYPGGKVKFRYQLAYGHQGVLELELPVAGAILRFVDADTGAVLTRAPDARPFKVQLIDTDQLSYQIDPPRSVTLTTALGGDSEPILLTEINPWYGIFEGTVVPRPTSSAANDGTLTVDREVLPNGTGIFDQVTASTYFGIWPQVLVSSTLQLDGPRLAWTDEAGQAVTQIQLGANAHLLVDDASRDTNPGLAETVVVTLDELPSGSETLVLTETGPTTGIFTGTIPVVEATPVAGDFQLQVTSGGVTRFHYSMPGTGSLQQAAWVTDFAITFVDANGNPTTSYLEGDTLRIRVRRSDLSGGSPTAIDVVPVQVRSLYWGLDQETVNLTETAVASGIFEGSIASQLAPTVQQNGVLEFSRGATFDAVITYWGTSGEASAQADFYGGSLRLLDRVGRPLNAIGFSQWLGVELTRLVGGDPQQVDTLVGAIRLQTLSNNNHDQEMLTLVETGPNTGIYIATIFTDLAPENPSDGYLQLDYQGLVRATFEELSSILQASVPITYNQAPQANGAFVEIAAGSTVGVERPWDSDPEGGALTLVGVGSSAHATGAIGPGNTLQLTAAADASGYESVAYLISDPVGMISEGTINIYYSSPPTITLLGPAPGTIFRQQGDVTLSAIASDLDEGDLTPYISWVSDLQGFLGSGGDPIFPAMFAQVGTHHLTASVTDASGHTATANLTIVIDGPPSFAVTAPPEVGEPIQEGAYTLRATATDLEDGDLGAAIVWTSVRRGSLGTGGELVVQMPPGEDQITATVTDSQGNSISIQRPVWVNSPPTAVITSPADGALLPEAEYFEIHATVGDPENLGYQLEWTVDTVPQQASYPALAIPLAPGQHRVSIRVTDPQGGEASDTVVFTVLSKPTLTISSPTQSQVFAVGAAVPLTATAADLEDGDLSAAIHWSSNIDGPLGIGASLPITTLSRALHVITATVEDSHGQVATSTVTIAVQDAPVVTITAPAPASAFLVGAPVNFAATAIDSESGDLSTEITWLSNLSGALGTGSALSLSNLPVGQHVVTARVSDPTGLIGTATVMITIHTAPSVSITAPATGTTVNQGSTVNFTGTANDNEDGSLAASISWSSNVDGVLGTGAAVVTSALSVGTHVITASVTDSHGAPATATVSITINAPPTVAITAPAAGSSYVIGASVSFTGSASDPEDGNLAAAISWSSSLGGAFGTGASVSTSTLPVGTHVITASVTDSNGSTATATRSITIYANTAPSVSITAPATGITVNQGSTVNFTGTASDNEDGSLAASISWSSTIDGALGTGAAVVTSALSVGTHVITASVTDSHGAPATATVSITINAPPTVVITAPAAGSSYVIGASVSFTGSASDPEDGNLAASISWSSSLGGALGSGASVSTSTLPVGTHVITASVTDSNGSTATATRSITIYANTAPSVSITAPATGTTVNQGSTVNFTGTANDSQDGNLSASISWSSTIDGALGTGAAVVTSALSVGTHVITASVTDSHGAPATATVSITINAPPTVAITAPAAGASFIAGSSVSFAGSASDPEDGNLAASISWSSSLSGAIGSGAAFSTSSLSVGTHVITASVSDSSGSIASATRSITIVANTAPTVSITSPTNGLWVAVGDTVTFTGSASDAQSGNLSASLVWTSNLAGTIGSGSSFVTSSLGVGSHTITAAAADPQGLVGSAVVSVEVKVVSTATYISTGTLDGFVLESGENTNVGGSVSTASPRLGDNNADRQYRSFLSFDTSALPDNAVIRKVTVRAQRSGTTGTNPATTHGTLQVDVKAGFFGSSTALESADFQSTPTVAGTCVLTPATANGQWSEGIFNAAGNAAVSLTGTTQVRFQFSLDDDDDGKNDFLDHYGGESTVASTRPQLVIEFLQ